MLNRERKCLSECFQETAPIKNQFRFTEEFKIIFITEVYSCVNFSQLNLEPA